MGYTGDSFKKQYDKNGKLIDPEDIMIDKTLSGFNVNERPKSYFQALCYTASNQNWCWKLRCTTCGSSHIRTGFYLIGKEGEFTIGGILSHLKNLRSLRLSFSEMEKVIIDASKADLNIIKQYKFPDWLGYIGLLYDSFDRDETSDAIRKLTESYCLQFQKILHKESNSYISIDHIIKSNYKTPFTLGLLERIETDILKSNFK